MNKSKRSNILAHLRNLATKKQISKDILFDLEQLLSNKIGLNFEKMADDVYENHINENKYVFMKKHPKKIACFNENAQTFGSIIESDNLLVLFLLQNTHKGKIDLIYIDPPYNTGNTGFIYNDDYRIKKEDRGLSIVNSEDSFRHSKWLSIMQPRLEYARTLLKETGFIVISIDNSELFHLKLLMDKIFGAQNFFGELVWRRSVGSLTTKDSIKKTHEYILIYIKNNERGSFLKANKQKDIYYWTQLLKPGNIGTRARRPTMWYEIICPIHSNPVYPIDKKGIEKCWSIGKKRIKTELKEGNINCSGDGIKNCNLKVKLKKQLVNNLPSILINKESDEIKEWPMNAAGGHELDEDMGKFESFDYPKPINLLKNLFKRMVPKDGLVLDFFAGSGTTACAVAELNKEDGGRRNFILVTNNDGDDKKRGDGYCIFRDVLYPRMQKNTKKYKISFKTFFVDNKMLSKVKSDDTFGCYQSEYIETCKSLLHILDPTKETLQKYHNDLTFLIDNKSYSIFDNNVDKNMRFDFKLRKNDKAL